MKWGFKLLCQFSWLHWNSVCKYHNKYVLYVSTVWSRICMRSNHWIFSEWVAIGLARKNVQKSYIKKSQIGPTMTQFWANSGITASCQSQPINGQTMDVKFDNQIGPDLSQIGHVWGFLRLVSVHFGAPMVQTYYYGHSLADQIWTQSGSNWPQMTWENPRIFPIWCQFDPFCDQIWLPRAVS